MGRWKNLFSWEGIRQVFDWTPVSVRTPRPSYRFCKEEGRILCGYEVEVNYLYHGARKQLFLIYEGNKGLTDQRSALRSAIIFYKETRKRIQKNQRG